MSVDDKEIMTIERSADLRYAGGIDRGLDAEPWTDGDRDFVQEAREELADAFNYLRWAVEQSEARQEDAHYLLVALNEIESAWRCLALHGETPEK